MVDIRRLLAPDTSPKAIATETKRRWGKWSGKKFFRVPKEVRTKKSELTCNENAQMADPAIALLGVLKTP